MTPAMGGEDGSFNPDIPAPIEERLRLSKKHYDEMSLSADAFVAVALGGLSNVHVLVVKVPGGRVTLRLTSAAGSQQLVPCEELVVLVSKTVPLTAIDVQRAPGVTTTVRLFLGEKA